MIFAANFKTNHTRATTKSYIEELKELTKNMNTNNSIYIFPPATALDSYNCDFTVGVQNAFPTENGAFTGEIGIEQLNEFGVNTILIGHSERRELLGETQSSIVDKFNFFKSKGFEIIYCIGEPIEVREEGSTSVMEYLLAQFEGIDTNYENLIVAYEPIWAIGTGRSATTEEISLTHSSLKATISKPILYGGSAKPANIKDILSCDGVDGVLVGSASLDAKSFSQMVLS